MSATIVRTQPTIDGEVPVLASAAYLRCKSLNYGWIVTDQFVLPFFIDKKLIFKRLIFTTEPIARQAGPSNGYETIWPDVVHELRTVGIADFIFKAQSNVLFSSFPEGSVSAPWGTYEVDLQKSDDQLLGSFHGKHRNVIRKAIRDGVVVTECSDPQVVYENIKQTLQRQKVPAYPSYDYVIGLRQNLSNRSLMMVARYEGALQGCALIVYDQQRAYYMYGGSAAKPYAGSINYLQYEAMKLLRDRGVKIYDLVGARINVEPGSKYEGIQTFKERFGATLRQGFAFRYSLNPIKYWLFNIAVKVFLRFKGLKYVDPIDQIRTSKA